MADNTELPSGSGGDTIRTHDKGTYKVPSSVIDVGGSLTTESIIGDAGVFLPVDVKGPVGGGTEAAAQRVTIANDSTGVVSVDDGGGSITVDNGGTFAVQVDAALPAGTNAIGKLAANSGVDIGDVDVLSVAGTVTVGGVAAENEAVSGNPVLIGGRFDTNNTRTLGTGDVGAIALTTRGFPIVQITDDASNNPIEVLGLAGTNGLGVAIVDTSGNQVSAFTGTEVQAGTSATAENGVLVFAMRDDALTTLTDPEGDAIHFRVDSVGALWVKHSGDVTIADGGNTISVDDAGGALTVDAANDGSLNVQVGDGSNTATVRNLAANDALNVAIVDASGNQITSFGGSGGTSSQDDAAFTAGTDLGTPAMGFFSTDTVNSGDVGVLAMDASRRLLCSIEVDNVGIGGGTQYTEDDAAAANPVGNMNIVVRADSLGAVTSTDGDNIALRGTNNGELYVKQTDVVPVNDNSSTLSIDDGGGAITVDGSELTTLAGAVSGTEMQVDVVAALPAGTNAIGKLSANADVDIGSITPIPKASGGVSLYRFIDLDETEEEVKATAGQIYGVFATNSNASVRYLKIYNATAATVVVGTTTPFVTLAIPPSDSGLFIKLEMGIELSTAITIAATTGVADADTGAPGANEVIGFILYK